MMFAVVVVAMCLVAATASAQADSRVPQFLEGVGVGLTQDVGNTTECAHDIAVSLEHFDAAVKGVVAGFDAKDVQAVLAALQKLAAGYEELAHAFTACGLFRAADASHAGAAAIGNGAFAVDSQFGITANGRAITDDVHAAVKYWNSNNVFQSAVYHGRMLNALQARSTLSARATSPVCTRATGTRVTITFTGTLEANLDEPTAFTAISDFLKADVTTCLGNKQVSDVNNSAQMTFVVRDQGLLSSETAGAQQSGDALADTLVAEINGGAANLIALDAAFANTVAVKGARVVFNSYFA